MSAEPPKPDDHKLTSLLLGQLPPEETDRLAGELADNSRVVPAAESLTDDTLLAGVRQATTADDPEADALAGKLVERLKVGSQDEPGAHFEEEAPPEPLPAELEYFRVVKELGRGGMGRVLLAQDTRLNRPVALKTLRPDLALRPTARERFVREARVAAALEHENVVPIYYVGEANGIPFLAMPVLKGCGLDDHLKANGGRLTPSEAVRIAAQVASGLAAAHAVGLVHRDIKPANLWVDADGRRVRVLDFGLARLEADEMNLTTSGAIVGTPAYMAPEQARGRAVDARADLFSLGVVLYQMLTGKRPFTGPDTLSLMSSLALDTPPAPNLVNFDVPAGLSDLVMRLLEKEPDKRPPSAAAVRDALQHLAQPPDPERTEVMSAATPRPRPRARPRRGFPVVPVAVALGLLAVLGGGAAAVYQFVFSTKDGTLVVEVDESADVRFKNGKLQVFDEKGSLRYTVEPNDKNKALPPGKYTLKVVGADGVKLDTDKFEIEKNGKALVRVTAADPGVARKPHAGPPDPVPATPTALDGKPVATPHWKPTADQQAFLTAVAALPANERAPAVLRKLRELNPVFAERPPTDFVLEPKGGLPTSCRVTSPITFEGWPLAALTSLKRIDLTDTHIGDFRPLSAIPLEDVQLKLILDNVSSEGALRWMPTLRTVNGLPAKEFWAGREAVRKDIDNMAAVAKSLPLEDQTIWVRGVMKRLHPTVDAGAFDAVVVVEDDRGLLQFRAHELNAGVYDFSPMRALPIESFALHGGDLFDLSTLGKCSQLKVMNNPGWARDLTPLAGLRLTELTTGWATDLRPLKGMPLRKLAFHGTPESDLTPLQGMPLEDLYLGGTKNLAPLAGLKLKRLASAQYSPIADLSPLKGMPLESLRLHRPQVTDLSPLAGMPLKEFSVLDPLVADFTPLKGMPFTDLMLNRGILDPVLATIPLKSLSLRFRLYSAAEERVLRSLKLEKINDMTPDDFWTDVEKRRKVEADKIAEMAKVPLEVAALEKALWIIGQYPKVKIENGAVVEVAAGHANGGLDNPFAVLTAFPKVRKLQLDSGGDYSALAKLTELEELHCHPLEVAFNRLALEAMPKLKTINGKPAKDVLAGKVGLAPLDPEWVKAVAAMPADKQVEAVVAELKKRNPMFKGEFRCDHPAGKVESFDLECSAVTDITPLAALRQLNRLSVRDNTPHGERNLPPLDITPLTGLPLVRLDLSGTQVTDLSPLKGMPLEVLLAHYTRVKDLTPLEGMPLTELGIGATGVTDLTPLAGMKLKVLGAHPYTPVSDVGPLAGMPLELLHIGRIQDTAPLKGMPIKDLTAGLRLYSEADEKVIRGLPLERWNDKPPADVWKEVEAARKADSDGVARLKKLPVEKEALEKALREECQAAVVAVTVTDGEVVGLYFEAGAPNQLGKLRAFPRLKKLTVVANTDMSALLTLPVEEIDCWPADVEYNRPILKAMPNLKTVNGKPAREVLAGHVGLAPLDREWVKAVAAMPPEKQYDAVIAELKKRNPELVKSGPLASNKIEGGVITELVLDGRLSDVSPVRALPGLTRLEVFNRPDHNRHELPFDDLSQLRGLQLTRLTVGFARVADLTPLRGMPLTGLSLFMCDRVSDLSPLAGLPLEELNLRGTAVADLTPIKGMKLKDLSLIGTKVPDLSVAAGMPLERLECSRPVTDLTPLKGKKLKVLRFDGEVVSDLSPLKGMPLEELVWWGSKVTDLSPLEGMALKNLGYELNLERDGKILHSLKSLETINGKRAAEVLK